MASPWLSIQRSEHWEGCELPPGQPRCDLQRGPGGDGVWDSRDCGLDVERPEVKFWVHFLVAVTLGRPPRAAGPPFSYLKS